MSHGKKIFPRLRQPLFSKAVSKDYALAWEEPMLASFVRAYDAIYNLLYYPQDMTVEEIMSNGEVNLQALGGAIEKVLGEQVFTTEPQASQMEFNLEDEQPGNSP